MVYNPARVAQSYYQGLERGETRKQRGLDQERIQREEAAKAKAAAKAQRIEGLTGRLYGGDESVVPGLMGLGKGGREAVTSYEDRKQEQTTRQRETQQFDREGAERELTQSMPRALTITDQNEWDQFEAWARPRSLAAGTSPEMYDQIANMPMAEAQNFLRQQLEGEAKAAPSGGIKNVLMPDGSTPAFDITNREQRTAYQDAIAAGGTDVPSKQLVGELAASGGKAEERELNAMATSTNTILRNIDNAVSVLEDQPLSGQFAGDLALFADNISTNVASLAGISGISSEEMKADIIEFSGVVEPIAASTSEFNSLLKDMAYAKALILNGTRPTEPDYQNAYNSLTGGSQNPKILKKNLLRAAKDMASDFRFRYRQSTGSDYTGRFDIEEKKTDYSAMSREELTAMDKSKMSRAEIDAAEKAWDKLNASN